jgi:hypothetical protein
VFGSKGCILERLSSAMSIRRPKDFYTGVMFLLFGGGAMALATEYQIGTAAKMGPGYFPFVLGGLLTALGIILWIRSFLRTQDSQERPSFHLKPLALVLSSVVIFSLLLRPLGLLGSTVALVLLSSVASHEFKLKEALLNGVALVLIVLIVFVYFLEFQVPVWPAVLVGRI